MEQCRTEPSRLQAQNQEETLTHVAMMAKPDAARWDMRVRDSQRSHLLDDPDAEQEEWQYTRSVQKGHGRLEIRELWASTQMNDWCETQWAGVAQVFRLHRNVQDGEKVREETVYGLTNLPRKKANASRLLAFQQAHWRIENRLHRRRDVTLGEDACQVRMSGAPQALAALNGGVLALMDWLQVSNVASQMRHFCAHPEDALQLLFCKLLRQYG